MMIRQVFLSRPLLSFMTLVLCASALFGQEFRATISGRVFDSSGATIPGARIHATNIAIGESSSATSDGSGIYSIPTLRPGAYRMTVQADGFKSYARENITLQVGQIAGIDVVMEVGAITETVEVTSDSALLETQTASRSGVVNNQQVAELPLNSRNPFMLGTMMAGVTFRGAAIWQRPFDNGAIAQWSVNGGRQSNNEFMMDGAPNNAQAGSNNIAYVPIVDAVQEFNVQMNSYDAQYGKTGGGVFNVILKSGTNDFHATGWEFARRKWLDANTFQGNAIPRPPGIENERANHTLDQYGFQVEGPIYLPKWLKKDSKVKLYYLGSFENYTEDTPNPLTNSFPEQEMRGGDFSKMTAADGRPVIIYDPLNATTVNGDPVRSPFVNNRIPVNRINPVAAAITSFMPLPNSPARAGSRYSTNNTLTPDYVNKDDFYNLILKFDWNFGDNHRAFVRHASNDRTEDRSVNGLDDQVGTDGQQPFQRINDAYVIDWVGTLTPSLIVNVRGSYNRFIQKGFGRANEGFDLTSLGLPASTISQLPGGAFFGRWTFNGYSSLGRGQSINITNNFSLASNITKIWGAHTIKTGIDLRRGHFIVQNTGNILNFGNDARFTQRLFNQSETTTGDSFASFLLGTPSSGSSNFPVFPFYRQWYFSPYFQDDWKITRKLSLNLGLRWDYNGPTDEKHNRLNRGFDPSQPSPIASQISAENLQLYPQLANLTGGLLFAGVNGQSELAYKRDLNNWQPRVGAAYSVNDKLVIRGGYGLYYMNPNNDAQLNAGFATNTPLVSSLDGNRTPLSNVLSNPYPTGINRPAGADGGAATFVGRNTNIFNPNFDTPKVHQFSVGIQYQTTQSSTLELTYVGSRSRDINSERDFNIPSLAFRQSCNPLEGGSVSFCNEQLPNPFKGIDAFRNTSFFTANNISRFSLNRPFPQFNGNLLERGRNDAKMWYNALQIDYKQRLASGLNIVANYTFSKTVEQFGFTDAFANIQQRGLYFNDRPHFLKFTAVYELPFGKSKPFASGVTGFADKLISGWQVTSFFTNSSGEPIDLPGNVMQLRDPSIENIDWKAHQVRGFKGCTERLFDNGTTQRLNCAAGEDPYWLMLPTFAPRSTPFRSGQIRKHQAFTMDGSINKMTQITERLRVQFRAEAFNLFNHNYFGRNTFNTNPTNPNFGTVFPATVSNQNSNPRQVQLGIKVYW